MSFFDRTAYAFRDQVCERPVFGAPVNRLGLFDGMTVNGSAVSIIKAPDQDFTEMGASNYVLHKQCQVDCLRDDYNFYNFLTGLSITWRGIQSTGLYSDLTKPNPKKQRPEVRIGDVTYQAYDISDDANVATVKITLRRKQ